MPPSGGIVQCHYAGYSFIITYFTLVVNDFVEISKVLVRNIFDFVRNGALTGSWEGYGINFGLRRRRRPVLTGRLAGL